MSDSEIVSEASKIKLKEYLGCFYNMRGKYASAEALGIQILDPELVGNNIDHLQLLLLREAKADKSVLETKEQYTSELSRAVGVEGNYSFFSAELSAKFRSNDSSEKTEKIYRHIYSSRTASGYLNIVECKKYIKGSLLSELDGSLPPKEFFEKYGTHILSGLIVGGVIELDGVVAVESDSDSHAAEVELDAAYGSIFKSSASQSKSSESSTTKHEVEIRVTTKGGDATLSAALKPETINEKLNDWESSVATNPEFIEFTDTNPLTPIWEFCKSGDRKKLFQDAFNLMYKKDPGPVEEEIIPYEITIITSSDSNAGADAQIKYYIQGTKGNCAWQIPSMEKGEFKKGQTFKTTHQFRDLGKITQVRLTQEPGKKDGWKVDQVIVKGGKPEEEVKFTLNNGWLKDFDDDVNISHDRIFDRTGQGYPQ